MSACCRIVLLDFAPTHGVVGSVSSFVTKVEAWLRFAGLDYEKKHGSKEDFDKAPKGKVRLNEGYVTKGCSHRPHKA